MKRKLMTWLSKLASEDQAKIIDDSCGSGSFEKLIVRLELEKKRELCIWRKGTTQEAAAEIAAKRMRSLSEVTKIRRLPDGTKRKAIQGKYFLLIKRLRKEGYSWALIGEYLKRYHNFKTTTRYLKAIFEEADLSYQLGGMDNDNV